MWSTEAGTRLRVSFLAQQEDVAPPESTPFRCRETEPSALPVPVALRDLGVFIDWSAPFACALTLERGSRTDPSAAFGRGRLPERGRTQHASQCWCGPSRR